MNFRKAYILIFILLRLLTSHGQISVGILNGTLTVIPSNTVTNGTGISVRGSFINMGNTTFSDYVHINIGIDTSTTGTPKYYPRATYTYSVTNFAPTTTHTFSANDVASYANHYKCCGDGTTVIIWPIVGSPTNTLSIHDTASTIVYVTLPTNLDNIESLESSSIKIQNPIYDQLIINYEPTLYTKVCLIDTYGKVQLDNVPSNETLNLSHLCKGVYYLKLYNTTLDKYFIKKVIIE